MDKNPVIISPAAHGVPGRAFHIGEINMILVVDIGNTTVSFGGVTISHQGEYRVTFTTKLDTDQNWDPADYTVALIKKLRALGRERESFTGIVISSVVPKVLDTVRDEVRKTQFRR